MVSQIDRLKVLAQQADIDVDLLINEIAGAIKDTIAVPDIDTETIVSKVTETMGKIATDLKGQVDQIEAKSATKLQEFSEGLPSLIKEGAENVLLANLENIKQQVMPAVERAQALVQPANITQPGAMPATGSKLDAFLPLLLQSLGQKQGLDLEPTIKLLGDIGKLVQAVTNLSPESVSAESQYKFGQAAFIEGLKARGGVTASPLPVEKSANPSAELGERSRNQNLKRKSDEEIKRELG